MIKKTGNMNLETPNKDINQESDSVSENKPKNDQNITPSIDPSIQSNQSPEEIDRLIRKKLKKQQKIISYSDRERKRAAKKAFYQSAAYKKTARYQRDLDNREAKGLQRKPPKGRIIKSADAVGHMLWTRF